MQYERRYGVLDDDVKMQTLEDLLPPDAQHPFRAKV